MTNAAKETVYSRITNQIIDHLERGVVPWVQPWQMQLPFNVVSGRSYRGVNVLSTWTHQLAHGYQCHGYLTFKQARDLGGWVKRGEHGAPIILYRPIDSDDEHEEEGKQRLYVARGHTIFCLDQIGGLDRLREIVMERRSTFEPLEEAERVVAATGAVIREGQKASYSLRRDEITIPARSAFSNAQLYYSTLLHELIHWSGSPGRLARDLGGAFGTASYAKEELVAELGAAFLAARLSIEHASRAASYLQSWLTVLRNDNRFLFAAARAATEAAVFIYPDSSSDPADPFTA